MWFFLVELCIFNELMRKLRRLPPEQGELVRLTGYDSRKDQEHALAGYQIHLAKPVEPEDLVNAIATLV